MYKELLNKIHISLEKLINNSQFYISAIELEWDLDGVEYEKEIVKLIEEIKKAIN